MLYTLYEAIPVWYEFVWTLIKDVDVCIWDGYVVTTSDTCGYPGSWFAERTLLRDFTMALVKVTCDYIIVKQELSSSYQLR